MAVDDGIRRQEIDKFRHCHLRYDSLLAQQRAEAGAGGDPAAAGSTASNALLQRLLAAFGAGGSDGEGRNGGSRQHEAAVLPPPTPFEQALVQEVQRLRLFVGSSLEQLWLALLDATTQLRGLGEELLQAGAASAGQSLALSARLAALRAAYDATAEELVLLERFLRQNVAAAAQLALMHDQQLLRQGAQPCGNAPGQRGGDEPAMAQDAVESRYLAALQSCLLGDLRLEPLVVGLSDGYELCRRVSWSARLIESDAEALAGQPSTWVPPDKFERVTRKFWLHPDDVMRFKAEVMRHLPILIYGDRTKLTERSPWEVQFLRDQRGVSDSAEVSSVYYDNPESLPSYHARLRKEDMASVVRLRWYGERSASGDQPVFVERKVHRERFTGEFSYKQRAPMAQRHVEAFTGGALVPEMGERRHADFLADAQQFLLSSGKAPLVRTVYRRTAFQESSNNQVRISLDDQLHMVREAGAPRAPGDWCRDMGAPLPQGDIIRFPYAVAEIKLQSEPPAWVEGLLQTGMLLPVPKFSKFLHGTALLFQPRCTDMPYWFLPDERDPTRMTPATWEEMADPADKYLQTKGTSGWLFPARGADGGNETVPNRAPEIEAVPYRPNPLRFLRRNKAGEGSPSPSPGSGSKQVSGAATGAAATLASGFSNVLVAASAAAGQQLPPPQKPLACSLAALSGYGAVGGQLAAPAAAPAVPAGQEGRLPSQHSPQQSIPQDSERDLEAGISDSLDKSSDSLPSKGGKQPGGGGKAGGEPAAARASGPAFGKLHLRLPGVLGGGNGSADKQTAGRPRTLVHTRVEPKTFFANERTFLQWLQISVLILMTSTSMLSGTGLLSGLTGSGGTASSACDPSDKACFASKLSGAIITPVGLMFMAYALYQYRLRTHQIMRRETTRYDDQRGTTLLTVILAAVFLLTYVLSMVFMF